MATYEQLMDAARRADSAGDLRGARRFLELAKEQGQPEAGGQMADMTLEQQRAIAMARARLRRQQQTGGPWEKYQKPEAGPWERFQTFEIQGPDGKIYEVQAPDQAAAVSASQSFTAQPQQEQSFLDRWYGDDVWDRRRDNIIGDDDPTTQNVGEKIGSFLNKAGESASMGLVGDEASAAVESLLPGVDYADRRDHYRQQEAQFETDHPLAALTADVGGAMAAPLGALGAVGKGAGWIKRAAASGGATGLLSGIYGFMEGEGGVENRVADAKADATVGGGIGIAIPLLGAGVQRVANSRATRKAIKQAVESAPSTEELRRAGQAAYQAIDDAGVQVKPERVRGLLDQIEGGLKSEGAAYTGAEKVYPASRSILEAAGDVGEGANAIPWGELDVFRRFMGNAAASNLGNRGDTRLATKALTSFDDAIGRLGPDDVDAGDIETLQSMLPKARDLWAKMSRSQMIDDAIEAADGGYVSGGASGLRNQFARIWRNKSMRSKFTEAERRMLKRVVAGSLPERLIHLAGGGLGQLFTIGGGYGTGGLLGAAVGTGVASSARKMSEKIASKNAEALRAVVANGGLLELPQARTQAAGLLEQLARQGTAAGVQR